MSHTKSPSQVLSSQALGNHGPFSAKDAVSILRVLVEQVNSLHAAGKIHGGINPDAVLISNDGALRLQASDESVMDASSGSAEMPADFDGVSIGSLPKRIDEATALLKQLGNEVDPRRVDVYQLGVLGCRLVTGRPLSAYLRSPKVKSQVPRPLQMLVDAALGFDPDRRISDCEALADALAQIDLAEETHTTNDSSGRMQKDPPSQVEVQFGQGADHSDDTPLPGSEGDAENPTPIEGMVDLHVPSIELEQFPPAPEELPFAKLGQYKVLARLGRGGMGDVYHAYDESLDRHVAIKVLPPELARHESFVRRFKVEAAAVAKLRHPNVVQVYCTGEEAGLQFFVMEFVAGESLAQMLTRRQRLEVDQVLSIVSQCLEGLEAAHSANLVHRDIKPGNILVERTTGRALLADFGLVKSQRGETSITSPGMVVGTIDYLAPEHIQNIEIDRRADLYSLGVVMYQMLSGQVPFPAESSTRKLMSHAFEAARPLSEVAPHVPGQLDSIVARLMAKDRNDRYQAAAEVLTDIKSYQSGTLDTTKVAAHGSRLTDWRNRVMGRSFKAANAGRKIPRRWNGTTIALACVPLMGLSLFVIFDGSRHLRPIPGEENSAPAAPVAPGKAAASAKPQEHLFRGPLGMEFVRIEPGEFFMGSFETELLTRPEEHPRHLVKITQPFYMGMHEVTRGQFRQFYEAADQATREEIDRKIVYGYDPVRRGLRDRGPNFGWNELGWEQKDNHPVVGVSYHTALAFCQWLSRQESRTYRLPTEAEWEYCCRANTTTRYYGGDADQDLIGFENTSDESLKQFVDRDDFNPWNDRFAFTAPVGSFRPNPLGLHDMLGNVREYCLDWYMGNYGTPYTKVDPVGPGAGTSKLVRGGAWNRHAADCRSASRWESVGLDSRDYDTGFRVVLHIADKPLPSAEPAPVALSPDPNRRAAQTVLRNRGFVQLKIIDANGDLSGQNQDCYDPLALPNSPLRVTNIDLRRNNKFRDDQLIDLQGLEHLERLNLSGTSIATGGINCLQGLKNLTELNLSQTQATDEILPQIRSLSNLTTLRLAGTFVTDWGLLKISTHPALQTLDLTNTKIDGCCFHGFAMAKNLKTLVLSENKIRSEHLEYLQQWDALTELTFSKNDISESSMDALLNLKNLQILDIHNCEMTYAAQQRLKEFKQLKILSASLGKFDAEFVRSLREALPDCVLRE